MGKRLRKTITKVCLGCMLAPMFLNGVSAVTSDPTTALAYVDKNGGYTAEQFDAKDPASWSQNYHTGEFYGNPGMPMNKKGNKGWMFDTSNVDGQFQGKTFTAVSCMIFALSYVIIKTGAQPVGWTPADTHDSCYDVMRSGGWMNYSKVPDSVRNGAFTLDDSKFYADGDYSYDQLKKFWDEGYGLILCVGKSSYGNLHAITVDKMEDGKIFVLDSGYEGNTYDDVYRSGKGIPGNFLPISGYCLVKMANGKKYSDLPVLNDIRDGNINVDNGNSNSNTPSYQGGDNQQLVPNGVWKPDEDMIPNMPKYREWLEMKKQGAGGDDLNGSYKNFVERWKEDTKQMEEDFGRGTDGASALAKWREENENNVSKSSVKATRVLTMSVALAIIMIIPLFMAMFFADLFNPFGVSLIALVTGGRFRVMDMEEARIVKKERKSNLKTSEGKPVRIITMATMVVSVLGLTLLAVVLLNGMLYEVMAWFVELIQGAFGW